MKIFATLIIALFISLPTLAQTVPTPTTNISEAEVETRAREVGYAIRCVVCQNEPIEESNATLAQDMRKLVRTRIREGDSNAEVMDYMQERYGDFVLLKPPVQKNTYILWFGPAIMLVMFMLWYVQRVRGASATIEPEPLSEAETEKFKELSAANEESNKQGEDA